MINLLLTFLSPPVIRTPRALLQVPHPTVHLINQTQSDQTAQTDNNTPDPRTDVITRADGTLIDPGTGGTIDPDSGVIHDPNTYWSIGLAEKYLNYTVCGIES